MKSDLIIIKKNLFYLKYKNIYKYCIIVIIFYLIFINKKCKIIK